jgi:hypothetical protein
MLCSSKVLTRLHDLLLFSSLGIGFFLLSLLGCSTLLSIFATNLGCLWSILLNGHLHIHSTDRQVIATSFNGVDTPTRSRRSRLLSDECRSLLFFVLRRGWCKCFVLFIPIREVVIIGNIDVLLFLSSKDQILFGNCLFVPFQINFGLWFDQLFRFLLFLGLILLFMLLLFSFY